MKAKNHGTAVRCVIYARISTKQQRKESIDDQFMVCEEVARREGFAVADRYKDVGISGGTANRPGYIAMLIAARDHEFDVIVTEDVSRLWRNPSEFGQRSTELEDLGIHWVSVVGDDTRRDGWGLTIQIKQAMAEHARREASYRTRRGLEGLARKGKSTGGRAYGYKAGEELDADGDKIRVIVPEQAEVVRRIYEWRADGWSGQRIARQLNAGGRAPARCKLGA